MTSDLAVQRNADVTKAAQETAVLRRVGRVGRVAVAGHEAWPPGLPVAILCLPAQVPLHPSPQVALLAAAVSSRTPVTLWKLFM